MRRTKVGAMANPPQADRLIRHRNDAAELLRQAARYARVTNLLGAEGELALLDAAARLGTILADSELEGFAKWTAKHYGL